MSTATRTSQQSAPAGTARSNLPARQQRPGNPTSLAQVPAPQNRAAQIATSVNGLVFSSLDELWKFCVIYADSGMAPKDMQTPHKICIAYQMGCELGLPFTAAVQNIAVINGRPSIWGDVGLALCQMSSKFDHAAFDEEMKLDKNNKPIWTCTVKRVGAAKVTVRIYSWDDAVVAGDAQKDTYKKYPKRMIQMRARWWALRDAFPDVLKGIGCAEEEARSLPPPGEKIELSPRSTDELLNRWQQSNAGLHEPEDNGLEPGEVIGEGGEIFQGGADQSPPPRTDIPECCPAAAASDAQGYYATLADLESDLARAGCREDVAPVAEFYTGGNSPLETADQIKVAGKVCADRATTLPSRARAASAAASQQSSEAAGELPEVAQVRAELAKCHFKADAKQVYDAWCGPAATGSQAVIDAAGKLCLERIEQLPMRPNNATERKQRNLGD